MSAAPVVAPPAPDSAELARLGIVRVQSEHFLVGPYRYSSLPDALAQARRGRTDGGS